MLIGTSELKITDEHMGVVSGKFIPNENYGKVRKAIWDFHRSNSKDKFQKIHNLRINCQLENEVFLSPLGGFLITDFKGLSEDELHFEAPGNYRHVIENFFLSNPPINRISKPWEYITIEQKIDYENELFKEIGKVKPKGILAFLKTKKHKLSEYKFDAIAKSSHNDDVLFSLNKTDENKFDYAVIHLTWKGKLESNDNYPRVEFYDSFNHFLNSRLLQDKRDWGK